MSTTTMAAAAEVGPDEATSRRRLPKLGIAFGVAWLAALVLLALFADYLPFIRGENQRTRYANTYGVSPSSDFWFGSDRIGKDVFARCIYGARLSLTVATASIIVGLFLGGMLGIIAGYFRGWIDRIASIVIDSLLAFPAIVISTLLIGRFDALQANQSGFGWLTRAWGVTIVFSVLSIAPVARIVRAQTLSIAQREYVLAARSLGAKTPRILVREVLPNLIPAMVAVVFTGIAILLAAEGGLAFIGYSVKPPNASWGLSIAESRGDIDKGWWATLFPALMLFLTVLAFNLIGDRLARRFDIREAAL
jgi:peptide/nickel transport system permease protein